MHDLYSPSQEPEETPFAFDLISAPARVEAAAQMPRPAQLFGDFWLEGELSVMFGEPGVGKSVLAVQIAQAIARGRAVEPFERTVRPCRVLYLDLGSSEGHFRLRYTADEPINGREVPFKFSERLHFYRQNGAFQLDVDQIEELIERTGAKAVVVDDLAFLMRSHGAKEAARVLRELRLLTRRMEVSILLLAQTAKAASRRGIEPRDMQYANVISMWADNIFAVGRVRSAAAGRYLKHIKPGSSPHIYTDAHVPAFTLEKNVESNLHFRFLFFEREEAARSSDDGKHQWGIVDLLKKRAEAGEPIRKIAKDLKMAKSTVHRYLKVAGVVPEKSDPRPKSKAVAPRPAPEKSGHAADPEQKTPEELAEAEREEQRRRAEAVYEAWGVPEAERRDAREPEDPADFNIQEYLAGRYDTGVDPPEEHFDPFETMTRSVDTDGNPIMVESYGPTGFPHVWYEKVGDGQYKRWVRSHFGRRGDLVNGPISIWKPKEVKKEPTEELTSSGSPPSEGGVGR